MLKHYKSVLIFISVFMCCNALLKAQQGASTAAGETPVIYYSATPQEYEIAGLKAVGMPNYEEYILINISGLKVGDHVKVPGDQVTSAINRYWKYGLFSDVKIVATKMEGSKIWLEIQLKERPKASKVTYHGLKKGEKTDLEKQIGMITGSQITPNLINTAKKVITKHFVEKGFLNTTVDIHQKDDPDHANQVLIDVFVDKKEKVRVKHLYITGNKAMSSSEINSVMKKTNEKGKLKNLFRTKKFIQANYEADKIALIDKYNELGYRDAVITSDSVVPNKEEDNTVDVYVNINEGKKYYFRKISWIGNSLYTSYQLNGELRIKPGDVYNQKNLEKRVSTDDDAISNLYLDKGYLFFNIDPVESTIEGDSIDMEMRIVEGTQATINNVIINGNTKTNEHVARREIWTRPGDLFSKSEIIRSIRELGALGHFDPEKINPVPKPNPEDGTVDLVYNLEEKANDQLELSGGWGAGTFVGTLGVSFSNFSARNLFNKKAYTPLPSGDGETLSLRAQTNGKYYQNYSATFVEPWLGGKKPNSLSVSMYYSKQTDVSNSSGYNMGGYGGMGTGTPYNVEYDASKYLKVSGISVGLGRRLKWPDDYFTLSTTLGFQMYDLQNWNYFLFGTGKSYNLNLGIVLSRNSVMNPIYPRSGSKYTMSLNITPPWSAFNNVDYSTAPDEEKYKWIEYHKWKFKGEIYTPLDRAQKLMVMTRAEFGILGYFDPNRKSPFETFYVGGDGMSGYSSYGNETIGLRGYKNGSLTALSPTGYQMSNAYTKLTMELRYPISLAASSTIYALGFLEAGNSWYSLSDINPYSLKRSAGVGLRIFLPMFGMMGIDWGYGFDTPDYGDRSQAGSQFHFVIGQQF